MPDVKSTSDEVRIAGKNLDSYDARMTIPGELVQVRNAVDRQFVNSDLLDSTQQMLVVSAAKPQT